MQKVKLSITLDTFPVIDSLTTIGMSEEVTVAGTVVAVSRLISELEESTENPHKITLLVIISASPSYHKPTHQKHIHSELHGQEP